MKNRLCIINWIYRQYLDCIWVYRLHTIILGSLPHPDLNGIAFMIVSKVSFYNRMVGATGKALK